jgi:hypothetical protein
MLKMHVGRFELFDIASDMEVIHKLLAIKFSLAGIYATDELLKLFSTSSSEPSPQSAAPFF